MSIATEPGPAQLRQHSYAVVRGLFDATTQRLRQIMSGCWNSGWWKRASRTHFSGSEKSACKYVGSGVAPI
jgi:hypothetical protein